MLRQTAGTAKSSLMLMFFVFIVGLGLAFGHGHENHEANEASTEAADTQMSTDTLAAAMDARRDSMYATIQRGFEELQPTFEKGCFDCHTNQTVYPWYYKLPVVSGMIDDDIEQARKHVDMTDGFPFKGHGSPADDLDAIRDELEEGHMPPLSYRMMHWDAKPSDSERDSIVAWVERSLDSLATIGELPEEHED